MRTGVTLPDLFYELQGQRFENRRAPEQAVVRLLNLHVDDLPIGFRYQDAIDGARVRGWLRTETGRHGVGVHIEDAARQTAEA